MFLRGELLAPFSVGYIKGWRRSTAFLCVCAGLRALKIDMEEVPANFKVLWAWGKLLFLRLLRDVIALIGVSSLNFV